MDKNTPVAVVTEGQSPVVSVSDASDRISGSSHVSYSTVALIREVHGHEGSTLNSATTIRADARDENGGSHIYRIEIEGGEVGSASELRFQRGPLKEAGLNGISDEVLLAIVRDRLEGFNEGPHRCRENSLAITKIEEALHWLQHRTAARQRRGVEGTHQV